MKKSNLIIGGIVLVIVVLVGGVFWYVNNSQKLKMQTKTEEVVSNNQRQNKQKEEGNSQEQEGDQKISKKDFKQLSPEEIEKLKKEKDLVWYEIPEMNIKFLVEKEIADIIGYRDFYVEDSKANGKELYVKDSTDDAENKINQKTFAEIMIYKKNDAVDKRFSHKKPKWDELCIGKFSYILFKSDKIIFCYDDRIIESNVSELSEITKKLFDGYLKTVTVKQIQENK